MTLAGSRLRQVGWAVVLAAVAGLFVALSFQVHSVKSEVLLAERELIRLERETTMLETEFQARANQRQLSNWNAIEFGLQAARPDQYIENERQLAAYGGNRAPTAPSPIRIAVAELPADTSGVAQPRAMVSPVSGKPVTLAAVNTPDAATTFAEALSEFVAEASPIRPAQARTFVSAEASE